jgi:lipopolysaccharide export system permease protein
MVISLLICTCIFCVSFFDILNKIRSSIVPFIQILFMAFLKLPYLISELFPLIIFISLLFMLDRMSKSNELIILFSSGISIWKLITPVLSITFLLSIIFVTIWQPIASVMLNKQEFMISKADKGTQNSMLISGSGLYIHESLNAENRVYTAKNISPSNFTFNEITILILDKKNQLIKKIEADKASLEKNIFELSGSILVTNKFGREIETIQELKTKLDFKYILDKFSSPEKIPFWKLGSLSSHLENSGINADNFINYYYKLLFRPLYAIAVCFLACCFISLNNRTFSNVKLIGMGSIVGLLVHGFKEIFSAYLIANNFSSSVAQIMPLLIIASFSAMIIFHKFENN